jgi:AraC-like DNA-binding protein/Tfp pilus assembly protein PilF
MKLTYKLLLLLSITSASYSVAQDSTDYFRNAVIRKPNDAHLLNRLSFEFSGINQDSCFYFASKAYQSAVNNHDTFELASALANIGSSKVNIGQPDLVLKYYTEALKLFSNIGAYFEISRVHNRLGLFYAAMPDNEMAIYHYKLALEVQRKNGISQKIEHLHNNLASSYLNSAQYDKSLVYLDSALIGYKKHNDIRGISYVLANKSFIILKKGDFVNSKNLLDQAMLLIRKNDDNSKWIAAYKLYAVYYIDKGNLPLARAYLDSIHILSKSLKMIEITNDNNRMYYSMYKRFGMPDSALFYFEKFQDVNDSIKNNENLRRLSEARALFEIEINEQKIINLNHENELIRYKVSSQKVWIWVLSIVLFIMAGLFLTILWLRNDRFQAQKKLVEKSLEQISSNVPIITSQDFEVSEEPEDEDTKYLNSNLTDEQKEEITKSIINLFEIDKIYLNPECSISMLEDRIGTNKTYISQVINEKFENNFKTILKKYRIKEATILLSDPKNHHLSIEGISLMVGFKSKSVFNCAFKSIVGVTPSFFQKENELPML